MSKQKLDRRLSLLRYANFFDWGGVIHNEPGFENCLAYASTPWPLDKYEKALGLKPNERWLLDKFLKHVWYFGGYAFPNLSRIAENSDICRSSLNKYLKSLKSKGYIHKIGKLPRLLQSPYMYSVIGLYNALTFAIINNQNGNLENLSENDKGIVFKNFKRFVQKLPEEVRGFNTPQEINKFMNNNGKVLDWETLEVYPLNKDKRPKYVLECNSCNKPFESTRIDDKTCINCKALIAEEEFDFYQNQLGKERIQIIPDVHMVNNSNDRMGEQSN